MDKEEVLKKLEERLAKGEISEKTYLGIKARYDNVPERKETAAKDGVNGFTFDIPSVDVPPIHIEIPGVIQSGSKLVVTGSGHVDGDVKNESCRIAGACTIEGSVETDEWKSAGSAKIKGSLKADMFKSAGSAVIGGDVHADDFVCAGRCSVGGGIDSGRVKFGGNLESKNTIKCDRFEGVGKVSAPAIAADSITIETEGRSDVREISGDSIEVRSVGRVFSQGELYSDRIRGERIYLENTTCKLVSGDDVVIGPNCEIETVEFRSNLKIHLSAKVKKKVRK